MKKYLVTFEFRYTIYAKDDDSDNKYITKVNTIGVFDTVEEAISNGNKNLEVLENHFNLNPNYNKRERFSKNGGCLGNAKFLISDLAYLVTPFRFFAKITPLHYEDTESTILNILKDIK